LEVCHTLMNLHWNCCLPKLKKNILKFHYGLCLCSVNIIKHGSSTIMYIIYNAHNNLGSYIYQLLLLFHVWPVNQHMIRGMTLCHKKAGCPHHKASSEDYSGMKLFWKPNWRVSLTCLIISHKWYQETHIWPQTLSFPTQITESARH
jgi:hypothetical protein